MNEQREPVVDERLSDWVDGRLSSRELERFEAEMRVNPALRAQAEEYRRTVLAVRAALTGDGPRVDMVGRVLAAVQHGRMARPPVMTAGATAAATGGRRPHWWAFAASSIVGAAAIVLFALLIDWQGAGKDTGKGANDDVAVAPAPAFRAFESKEYKDRDGKDGKEPEVLHKSQEAAPQGGGGEQERRVGYAGAGAAVAPPDSNAFRSRLESHLVEEQPATQRAEETFAELKGDAAARGVSGQPPADRPAAPAAAAPKQPAPEPSPEQPSRGERRAFKDTGNPEGLVAGGDGGAKKAPAPGKPGEVPAATAEALRQTLGREVVTQIVLSPKRSASELEDRSKGRTDSKPFDLQAIAQGLRLQALAGVPVRAADAEQAPLGRSEADKSYVNKDVDKGGAGKPSAEPEAQKAETEKAQKAEKIASGVANRADAERAAAGAADGDKKASGEGTAWLIDGSPQEIRAFLARLADAAPRAGLDMQNGEADADSVLALLPVQPQGGLQQKGGEGDPLAGGREKAKSPPVSGPSTGGPGGPSAPLAAARVGVPRVRLVIVLRSEAPTGR